MKHKNRLLNLTLITLISIMSLFPMQESPELVKIREVVGQELENLRERITQDTEACDNCIRRVNQSMALAHSANGTAIRSFETATEGLELAHNLMNLTGELERNLERVQGLQVQVENSVQLVSQELQNHYNRLSTELSQRVQQTEEVEMGQRIELAQAQIREMQQCGVYRQGEEIRAQALVDTETAKWKGIGKLIGDQTLLAKVVLGIGAIVLCFYLAKYGIPALINYFTRPRVISETSRLGWFDWNTCPQEININDLIFSPSLEKKCMDLALRLETAQAHSENLPNILLYGPPGTGKSSLAKALASYSGLNYALTSGSEFAKITDLNRATAELRKFLKWSKDDKKGLIVFFDEAESLFLNRKFATTSKITQDFINTFLALLPEKSQKNLMFIFATNHPFKLDDAILDRVGITFELTLPEVSEREKILTMYLKKYALENEDALVELPSEILQALPRYAHNLEGFSPRALKCIAEHMVVKARRQPFSRLTHEIAQMVVDEAISSRKKSEQWEHERTQWVNAYA